MDRKTNRLIRESESRIKKYKVQVARIDRQAQKLVKKINALLKTHKGDATVLLAVGSNDGPWISYRLTKGRNPPAAQLVDTRHEIKTTHQR